MVRTFLLLFGLSTWIPDLRCEVITDGDREVLEGKSLTISCHYEPQYASYVKYWCQGKTRDFCSTLARTDDPVVANSSQRKVSIRDDPVQQLFVITMRDLKESDSGWYMCGVEIGSVWHADASAFSYIKVIHGLSVVKKQVSGYQGSSVQVECLYSQRFRESQKRWCRCGNWSSCRVIDPRERYQDDSLTIVDNGNETLTVTLKNIQMNAAGWYWCGAGNQLKSVEVAVSRPPVAAPITSENTASRSEGNPPPSKPVTKELCSSRFLSVESVMLCVSVLLLIGLAIFATKMWKLHKNDVLLRNNKGVSSGLAEYSDDACNLHNATVLFLNTDSPKAQLC
ncbi:polymeric immunoglobulin receptor [Synchiropus picturatus]